MGHDLLRELRYLGITARIKRLSDGLSCSIKELYREKGVNIEPSWHLVFLALKRRETATMTELAAALQLSQPAITKMIRRMIERGYLDAVEDGRDGRKKQLRLSEKAIDELPRLEAIWDAGQKAIEQMLETNQAFFVALDKLERQVRRKSFKTRALEWLA